LLPELGTVIESLNEFENVLDTGGLSEESNSLLIKRFWFLENIFFLREKEKITFWRDLFTLTYVLKEIYKIGAIKLPQASVSGGWLRLR
jgi:hypothetical protein